MGVNRGGTIVPRVVTDRLSGLRAPIGLERPAGWRGAGSGIGAGAPGLDRGLKVRCQLRAMLVDKPDRGPDGLCHVDARPFGGRCERPVTAPQTDRACQLPGQVVELMLQAGGAFGVPPVPRLLELLVEHLEPSGVVHFGLIVEQGIEVRWPRADSIVLGVSPACV